tara:strand:+ start:770 stop:955 length:186 start_codon:yes stop_codon:yes gene_type:complete
MTRLTTSYYTLEVERYGRSGPENERKIEKFIQSLEGSPTKDKYMNVIVRGHDFDTVHETVG